MSNEQVLDLAASDLSAEERRAVRWFGARVAILVFAGLVSFALLAYCCLSMPTFRVSVGVFWGSVTLLVLFSGLHRLASRDAQLLIKAARQAKKRSENQAADSN
jgi:cytochrome b subunit of formate dehydrogenase